MDESAIRQGVYITFAYMLVFYTMLIGQTVTRHKLIHSYRDREERFQRYYNTMDKEMLGWDRIVGNMMEQSMPFLTLFWINIGLAAIGLTDYVAIAAAGWVNVVFRALYPVAWLAGGGGRTGPRPLILTVTPVMYLVIIYLAGNMIYAVR